MNSDCEHYRNYLRQLLAERMNRNPSYSLHAFSTKVGVARGFLSEVMNGKKNLSSETAAKIASRLELPADQAEYFGLLVQLGNAKNPEYRETLLGKITTLRPDHKAYTLSIDSFRVISEWYHLPLLDMTSMDGFDFSPKAAARRLGLSVVQVETALERLVRLELLEKTAMGTYRKTTDNRFLAETKFQNEAVLRFHRQILERLTAALETQTRKERLSRTDVLLFDPELYPKVEEILDGAAEAITELSLKSKIKSRICALGLHFFNLIPERKLPQ